MQPCLSPNAALNVGLLGEEQLRVYLRCELEP